MAAAIFAITIALRRTLQAAEDKLSGPKEAFVRVSDTSVGQSWPRTVNISVARKFKGAIRSLQFV